MKIHALPIIALAILTAMAGCRGPSKAEIKTRDNLHKIHSAFMDYAEDKGGGWPGSLEDLRPYVKDFDAFMTNPITGDNPGYRYTPPSQQDLEKAAVPETEETEGLGHTFVVVVQLRDGEPDLSLRKLYSDGTCKK